MIDGELRVLDTESWISRCLGYGAGDVGSKSF